MFADGVGRAIVGGEWDDRPLWKELGLGSAYIAPLGTAGKVRGVLVAAKRFGALPFDAGVVRMLTEVGGQVAVALELADRRSDADLLALYADRDRIGRDLHDLAIQRLFADRHDAAVGVEDHREAGGAGPGQQGRRPSSTTPSR